MRLAAEVRGSGERSALQVHGMMGCAESWRRVTEALVDEGFLVVAVDLLGHGNSPRDRSATVTGVARAHADTARAETPGGYRLAIGHSFGGLALAAAAPTVPADYIIMENPEGNRFCVSDGGGGANG